MQFLETQKKETKHYFSENVLKLMHFFISRKFFIIYFIQNNLLK